MIQVIAFIVLGLFLYCMFTLAETLADKYGRDGYE